MCLCCYFIVAGHAKELLSALSQGGTPALQKISEVIKGNLKTIFRPFQKNYYSYPKKIASH